MVHIANNDKRIEEQKIDQSYRNPNSNNGNEMRFEQPEVRPHDCSELKKSNRVLLIRPSSTPSLVDKRSWRSSIRLEDVMPDTNDEPLNIDNEIEYENKSSEKIINRVEWDGRKKLN